MWNKNKPKADIQRYSGKMSLIAADAELVGEVRFEGAVQIDGRLRGSLMTKEGLVRVSLDGRVEGEIRACHVVIDGEVVGDIYATEHLELGARAKVQGTLYYGLMEMAQGAQIEGTLHQIKEQDSGRILELPVSVAESSD